MSLDADAMFEKLCSYFNGKFESLETKINELRKEDVPCRSAIINELESSKKDLEEKVIALTEKNGDLNGKMSCLEALKEELVTTRDKNEQLKEERLVSMQKNHSLLMETKQLATDVSDVRRELCISQERVHQLEKEKSSSNIRCEIGEHNLDTVAKSVSDAWGGDFVVENTSKTSYSGDRVLRFKSYAKGQTKEFVILCDSKNYKTICVQSGHFEKAIRDAKHVVADAVVLVYEKLPPTKFPSGLASGQHIVDKMNSAFDVNLAVACTLQTFQVALCKIMLALCPITIDTETVGKLNVVKAMSTADRAMAEVFALSAPILKVLDTENMIQRAKRAEKSLLSLSHQLEELPNGLGETQSKMLQEVFPSAISTGKNSGKQGAKVLGPRVGSLLFSTEKTNDGWDSQSSKKRKLDEEASDYMQDHVTTYHP